MHPDINNANTQTQETQSAISPDDAIKILKEGNQRFVRGKMLNRDLNEQVKKTASGQYPFAAVLCCIDSRVPAEVVFDQGIGDIFTARVAGNFVNEDILGSLEFACKVAGSKLIVVLGHTHCGAVKGACDDVKLGNLTAMLRKIKPAIKMVEEDYDDRSSANPEFVQKVAGNNVALTVRNIREDSDVLREMSDAGEIAIVGAMYDVETGEVTFY